MGDRHPGDLGPGTSTSRGELDPISAAVDRQLVSMFAAIKRKWGATLVMVLGSSGVSGAGVYALTGTSAPLAVAAPVEPAGPDPVAPIRPAAAPIEPGDTGELEATLARLEVALAACEPGDLEATRAELEAWRVSCETAAVEARRAIDFFGVLADSCELPEQARPRPPRRPLPMSSEASEP